MLFFPDQYLLFADGGSGKWHTREENMYVSTAENPLFPTIETSPVRSIAVNLTAERHQKQRASAGGCRNRKIKTIFEVRRTLNEFRNGGEIIRGICENGRMRYKIPVLKISKKISWIIPICRRLRYKISALHKYLF